MHIEITTLVIPGKTDTAEEIRHIAAFIASINKEIPLHLSCYHPSYKYSLPPTKPEIVFRLAEIAAEKLLYVYPGNIGLSECSTICPECGCAVIKRVGYSVDTGGLKEGACKNCCAKIAGEF
jgi:pyruvate formate lyase activating enzyme